MEEIRLQKYISDCGLMSRRKAEEEIINGNILVNDKKVELGTKITPNVDIVKYNGEIVSKDTLGDNYVYVLLNKPTGYITTTSDEKGRKNVIDLLSDIKTRVYPIGRLDMYSEGLLLLTNDGDLTNKLTHPSHHVPKTYKLKIFGLINDDAFSTFTSPMIIDDYEIKPVKANIIANGDLSKDGNVTSTIKVTLYEGRNRQIRKMCEKCNWVVKSLKRISIGNIKLGELKPGQWRYLTKEEIDYLKGI